MNDSCKKIDLACVGTRENEEVGVTLIEEQDGTVQQCRMHLYIMYPVSKSNCKCTNFISSYFSF